MAFEPSHETWLIDKPAVYGRGGMVVSQHYRASQIGADLLADGGNAVDAAIATSLAVMTQEPWMSGLGGGGYLLVYLAKEQRCYAIDFGLVAPSGIRPEDYPLVPGRDNDLFGWPAVTEQRNLHGYHSMLIPGQVAGLALAQARFATRSWDALLAPATALARRGLPVDWYATLKIAAAAKLLSRYPGSRAAFLPQGFVPAGQWGGPTPHVVMPGLAETLEQLARAGAEDFYRGEVAAQLIAEINEGGGRWSAADLASYRARCRPAVAGAFRHHRLYCAPGLNGGPTLLTALGLLEHRHLPDQPLSALDYAHYARCLLEAYRTRLDDGVYDNGGDDELDQWPRDAVDPACTTHLNVVDRHGNMVALTQTLLSVFGSKVVLPKSGILMNNGMMWFNPEPGHSNSIAPRKRPLANMCPVILERSDGLRVALGGSGGRRILAAVYQLIAFLCDHHQTLAEAFRTPRIDVSGKEAITADARLPTQTLAQLQSQFAEVSVAPQGVYPNLFACPNAVARDAAGECSGMAFIPSPWSSARAADKEGEQSYE